MFFMLLGSGTLISVPVDHTCDPYTRPLHTAANGDLTDALVRLDHAAANTNLCEEMT
jgi:hypothetical protein